MSGVSIGIIWGEIVFCAYICCDLPKVPSEDHLPRPDGHTIARKTLHRYNPIACGNNFPCTELRFGADPQTFSGSLSKRVDFSPYGSLKVFLNETVTDSNG